MLDDLRILPANRLEVLKGQRKGRYGIRINDQWRVCLTSPSAVESRWIEGDAHDVDTVDYH